MAAPSAHELNQVRAASAGAGSGDMVVNWQSSFGLIVIEVRGEELFVNGEWVERANLSSSNASSSGKE